MKMRVIICKDYEEMSRRAANIVSGQIFIKPDSVLGLATGNTPIGLYRELVRMHKEEGLDFSEVSSFNLDEYVGLPADDVNSYHYYMNENLFKHINMRKENINIPDGMAKDMEKECLCYEEKIKAIGGIDLQVLGIGNNAHIGFNEPDIKFEAMTHKVKLEENTLQANARFFGGIDNMPKYAVSMGIRTIMHARKIVLMANGRGKSEAVSKALYGDIKPDIPASILQLHKDVTVIIDRECAEFLRK
jgi:glucosamine-6-phosphate deaminase